MEMLTLQVYIPPCDVSRGEKVSFPVSDCTEPPEFSHWTMGDLIRLAGTGRKLHSTERGWPAGEVRIVLLTVGVMSSA